MNQPLGVLVPRYLPAGYKLRSRRNGVEVDPFETYGSGCQPVQAVYTAGATYAEWMRQMLIITMWPTPKAELPATEGRPGLPVNLGVKGALAVYHDGWWAFGTSGGLEWRKGQAHSVTVHTGERTYAVRGPDSMAAEVLATISRGLISA